MSVATVTSKGQVTLPKEIRDELGIEAGTEIMFVRLRSGEVRMVPRTGNIMDLAGILHDPDRPKLSDEELKEAIRDGWAASGMRGLEPSAK